MEYQYQISKDPVSGKTYWLCRKASPLPRGCVVCSENIAWEEFMVNEVGDAQFPVNAAYHLGCYLSAVQESERRALSKYTDACIELATLKSNREDEENLIIHWNSPKSLPEDGRRIVMLVLGDDNERRIVFGEYAEFQYRGLWYDDNGGSQGEILCSAITNELVLGWVYVTEDMVGEPLWFAPVRSEMKKKIPPQIGITITYPPIVSKSPPLGRYY